MKRIVVFALAAVMLFSLAGCAQHVMGVDVVDETGAIKITAENVRDAEALTSITIGEGDCVVFSPDLTKGSIVVKLTATGDTENVIFEEEYSGRVLSTETIAPGTYDVILSTKHADGSMIIAVNSIEEINQQNESLGDTLTDAGVDEETVEELTS